MKQYKAIRPIFDNSTQAIAFGESADVNKMGELFGALNKVITQQAINTHFNIQLLNEALHAYMKDDWYQLNKEKKVE
jgi:hypothetical protein